MSRLPLPSAKLRTLLMALAVAVSPAAHAADAPASAPKPAAAPAVGGDPVVARVNGFEYHKSDVLTVQHSLPPQMQAMSLDQIYPELVTELVNGRLLADAGRQQKMGDDPEVKRRIAQATDRIIAQAYASRMFAGEITDAKLHAAYDKAFKDADGKEEVHARHILVDTEAKAKAIIAKLDGGADFAKLADATNKKGAAGDGGDLGWFTDAQMVPEFSAAAFKLKKGEYTKTPVKTQFGWHVIKVEDRRKAKPPSFDDAKEQITQDLERQVIDAKLAELHGKAKIETFGLDGKPLPVAAKP